MTLQTFPYIEQGTEEWHDQRRGLVTASTIGQLLSVGTLGAIAFICPACAAANSEPCQSKRAGAGPIKTMHPERVALAAEAALQVIEPARGDTARSLTRLLVAERLTGWTDPTYVSDDMLRGMEDEPRALEVYEEHHAPVTRMGFMTRMEEWGTLGFSPDGLVGDDGIVEVKSRRAKKQLQTILDGQVPAENMAQIQGGLLVSERKWCDYISFTGGMPMLVIRVFPDEAWFQAIRDAVRLFEETAVMWTAVYRKKTAGLPVPKRIVYEDRLVI